MYTMCSRYNPIVRNAMHLLFKKYCVFLFLLKKKEKNEIEPTHFLVI